MVGLVESSHFAYEGFTRMQKFGAKPKAVVKEFGRFIWRDRARGTKTTEDEMKRIVDLGLHNSHKSFFDGWDFSDFDPEWSKDAKV